jgi:hypothetical protein
MRNRSLIVFLPLVVLSLSGWFWNDKSNQELPVVGVWKSKTNNELIKLSFDSDGLFKADFVNEKLMDISGEYRVLGDQFIFNDDRTTSDTDCRDKAYYYFKIIHEELRMTLIADTCAPRRAILPGRWELISSPKIERIKRKKIKI